MVEYDSIKVKDQLGRPEDKAITVKRYSENVVVESGTLKISKNSLGHSWIVGSATNGIVGANTSTEDGQQQVVGAAGRDDVLYFVVNPNKTYREWFRDSEYEDTGSTTADWGDVEGQLDMTAGEIAQSLEIAYNDGTVVTATINISVSSGSESDIAAQLSADGGSHWESVTIGTPYTFTNTGTDLRFKLTASGTVTITNVRVEYG